MTFQWTSGTKGVTERFFEGDANLILKKVLPLPGIVLLHTAKLFGSKFIYYLI